MKHVRIHITGIVQGVGMRPFVYREAVAHGISGWVLNAGDGVHIEACAAEDALEVFVRSLRDHAPAASRIDHIAVEELDAHDDTVVQASTTSGGASARRKHSEAHESCGMPAFRIIASRDATAHTTLVSPDIATCDDCYVSSSIPQTDATITPSSTAPTADRALPSFATCPTIASRPP